MKLDSSSTEIACRSSLPSMRRRQAAGDLGGQAVLLPPLRLPHAAPAARSAWVSRVNRA